MDLAKNQDPYLVINFGTEKPQKTSYKANAGLFAEWGDEFFDFQLDSILENQIDKCLMVQAFDSDYNYKKDDHCGDTAHYRIGCLLKKLGKKPIKLTYRLFLKEKFEDNGYV